MAKDQEFPEILSKQESVNIQKAEPGAPPTDPKPAATVLLVRALDCLLYTSPSPRDS